MTSFTVNGTALYSAFLIVQKICGANPEMLTIKANNNKIHIKASSNVISMMTLLEADTDGCSEFSAPLDRLKPVCNRRGPMTFTLKDQIMRYKALSGAYRGDMVVSGITPIDMLFTKDSPVVPLINVGDYIPFVDLNPVIGKEMLLFFTIKNNHMYLAAGDNFHAVLLSIPKAAPDMQLMLPMAYQKLFNSVFGAQTYALHKTDRHFFARGQGILIQLPVIDEGDITFDAIKQYVEAAHEHPLAFKLQASLVSDVIDSLSSVNDDTKSVKLTVKDDKLVLSMQSALGRAVDELLITPLQANQKNGSLPLNYSMLKEVLAKIVKADQTDVECYTIEQKSIKLCTRHKEASIVYLLSAVAE